MISSLKNLVLFLLIAVMLLGMAFVSPPITTTAQQLNGTSTSIDTYSGTGQTTNSSDSQTAAATTFTTLNASSSSASHSVMANTTLTTNSSTTSADPTSSTLTTVVITTTTRSSTQDSLSVTISSTPFSLGVVLVDGSPITTPRTFSWRVGSSHNLFIYGSIYGYQFQYWQLDGAIYTYSPNLHYPITAQHTFNAVFFPHPAVLIPQPGTTVYVRTLSTVGSQTLTVTQSTTSPLATTFTETPTVPTSRSKTLLAVTPFPNPLMVVTFVAIGICALYLLQKRRKMSDHTRVY